MTDITAQQDHVKQLMGAMFTGVDIDGDGDLSIRHESSRVFVRVVEFAENSALAMLFSPLVQGATDSPELREFVAFEGSDLVFGNFTLVNREGGTVDVLLRHNLLADHLQEAELGYAIAGLASTADEYDDKLAERFGGAVFHPAE